MADRFAALADATRLEIVAALRYRRRPVSTSDLKRVTGTRSIAGHLGILSAAEWIEQVGPDARTQTLWQLSKAPTEPNPLVQWDDEDLTDESTSAAARQLSRASTYRRIDKMRTFDEEVEKDVVWSEEWSESAVGRDYLLCLTPTQLTWIDGQIAEVLEEAKALHSRNQDEETREAEAVMIVVAGFPVHLGDEK